MLALNPDDAVGEGAAVADEETEVESVDALVVVVASGVEVEDLKLVLLEAAVELQS